jgi:hypothetical protein
MAEGKRFSPNMTVRLEKHADPAILLPGPDVACSGFAREPFPRIVMDNFVPADQYAELHATFPDASEFMHHKNGKYILTDEYELSEPKFTAFLERTPPWRMFIDSLRNRKFVERIGKLFPVFDPSGVGAVRFHFSRLRYNGGQVLPHIDTPKKIVPIVLYMPDDDWRAQTGGELEFMEFKECQAIPMTGYEAVQWGRVNTLVAPPFVANRAVLMRKGTNSIHGVRPIPKEAMADRTSVTITLCVR